MRTFASSIGLVLGLLSAFPAAAAGIRRLDGLTNTTDRFISGQPDDRLIELSFDKAEQKHVPAWLTTWIDSTKLHCARTLHNRNTSNPRCGSAISNRTVAD